MNSEFSNLWKAFAECDSVTIEDAVVRANLPSPWLTWTLIGLARHHQRQNWVADIVKYRLGGELDAIGGSGALGHPDIPQKGIVPGFIEWEYYFHGRGCCLTHRASGEAIDVDFYDNSGDYFDRYFYSWFLKSLRSPEPPEQRIIELHPSFETCHLAMDELREYGLLAKHPDWGVSKLADEVHEHMHLIDAFCKNWSDASKRPACAVSIGDWLAAANDTDPQWEQHLVSRIALRADQCNSDRLEWLRERFQDESSHTDALLAIGEVSESSQDEFLMEVLHGVADSTMSAALAVLSSRDDPQWCDAVYGVLQRVQLNGSIPEPYIWRNCAQFLLKHDFETRKVSELLPTARGHELGEVAILALEYAPQYARELFRRALRSTVPHSRIIAAAALAIIDRPWSMKELEDVLHESHDQTPTAECRAALITSHDVQALEVVRMWEERNPHEPETGPYFTFDELSLRHRDEFLQYEMARYHDRVLPLRDRIPDEE